MTDSIIQTLKITLPQQVNNMMAYHLMLARKYTIGYHGLNLTKEQQPDFFTKEYRKELEFYQHNGKSGLSHHYHPYDDGPVTETLVSASVIYGRSLLNFFRLFLKPSADQLSFGVYGFKSKGDNDQYLDFVLGGTYPNQESLEETVFKFMNEHIHKNEVEEFLKFANRFTAHITSEQVQIPRPEAQLFINQATLVVYELFKKFIVPFQQVMSEERYLKQIWFYDQIESQSGT